MSKIEELDEWTTTINKVVNVLRCELDGGFIEETNKYKDDTEEFLYSVLRAIAVQIYQVFEPKPDECQEKRQADYQEGYSAACETMAKGSQVMIRKIFEEIEGTMGIDLKWGIGWQDCKLNFDWWRALKKKWIND